MFDSLVRVGCFCVGLDEPDNRVIADDTLHWAIEVGLGGNIAEGGVSLAGAAKVKLEGVSHPIRVDENAIGGGGMLGQIIDTLPPCFFGSVGCPLGGQGEERGEEEN